MLLQTFLSAAVIMDWKCGRIRNWLIAAGLICGCAFQLAAGKTSIFQMIISIIVPVFLCGGLFFIHALGAGDIKLLMVVGSFLGISDVVLCTICSFAAGAVVSLIKLLINGNLIESIGCFCHYVQQVYHTKQIIEYPGRKEKRNQIHFSFSILLGFFLTMGVRYGGIVFDFI